MKILMVQQNFPPYRIIGSLMHAYLLATRLAKMGHEVHVLLENASPYDSVKASMFGHYPWDGIIVHRCGPVINSLDMPSYIMMAGHYIKKLEKTIGFDVIHAHTAYAGFLTYYKPETPTVVTVHGVYAQLLNAIKMDFPYVKEPVLKKLRAFIGAKLYAYLEGVACRRADAIIAITPKEKRLIIESYDVNPCKVFVIPNGVDPCELRSILEKHPSKMDVEFERPIVLFVGRLSSVKGLPQLLMAWRILKSRGMKGTLVIAGRVWSSSISEYTRKFSHSVRVLQDVSREDLLSLYSKADIFVLPSLFEGLPYTLLDALALGKPAVVSNRLNFEELLGDCVLYADPLNPKDFADKMQTLMENEELRDKIGKKAESIVQSRFSLDFIVRETIRVYEKVSARKKV
jgi:glycosyltransferase involved in cell wall biosynthesis